MKKVHKDSIAPFGLSYSDDSPFFRYYMLKIRIPLVYKQYSVCEREILWGSTVLGICVTRGEVIFRTYWEPLYPYPEIL